MRKCLRCSAEMVENLDVRSEGIAVTVAKPTFFGGNLAKVKAAVCPECGTMEFYADKLEKIRDYMRQQ